MPVARTRLTTDATPKFAETMSRLDERGFDVFDPANFAPMIVFLASDKATKITGEVFRIAGDRCWVYQGWHTVNEITNDGNRWTSQILAERVKKELSEFKEKQIDEKKVNELSEKEEQLSLFKKKRETLNNLISKFNNYRNNLKSIEDEINSFQKQEKELTKGIKICPLCNQPIKK